MSDNTETLEDMAAKLWVEVDDLHAAMLLHSKPEGLCTVWTGPRDGRGYGNLKRRKGDQCGRVGAHRLAYAMHVGSVHKDLCVLHLCDNKLCVNPHHLAMGTHKANMYDLKAKGGAAHGDKHPFSKLSAEDVNDIRVLYKYGAMQKDLAERFGVARCTISKVVTRSGYSKVA